MLLYQNPCTAKVRLYLYSEHGPMRIANPHGERLNACKDALHQGPKALTLFVRRAAAVFPWQMRAEAPT